MRITGYHHRELLLGLLAALLAVSGAVPSAAETRLIRSDTKPADPEFDFQKAPFDCTPVATVNLSPGVIDTLRGDTTGGQNQVQTYSCAPWTEQGPEQVYQIEVSETLVLWAALRDLQGVDLDLFVLQECDNSTCLVGANEEFAVQLDPGTYFLVLDGDKTGGNPGEGSYTAALEARYPGIPPSICEPGGAIPYTCAGDTLSIEVDMIGRPNLVQMYDCSPGIQRGGEWWFAITLPGITEFLGEASSPSPGLDVALWIFDGCGPDAICLDYVNLNSGGGGEKLGWINDGPDDLTVYMALDCFRTPTEPGTGDVHVDISCQSDVASDLTTFGALKATYR